MNSPDSSRRRLLELLADQAVNALDDQDADELQRLRGAHADVKADTMLEAAALVELATLPGSTPSMPDELSNRLHDQARQFARAKQTASVALVPDRTSHHKRSIAGWMGWVVAASLLVAFLRSWLPELTRPDVRQRRQALASLQDAIQVNWQLQDDSVPSELTGDVTWSNSRQQGYLRFVGLPVNNPGAEQYQLWIIDSGRPNSPPVDGGVFNIDREGEVVIPIDAKLRVYQPAAFAITIERPGGVVVSDQSRLPLLASVPPRPPADAGHKPYRSDKRPRDWHLTARL